MTRLFQSAESVKAKSEKNKDAWRQGDIYPDFGESKTPPKSRQNAPQQRGKPLKVSAPKKGSEGEEMLAMQLHVKKIGDWKREYRFSPPRRWRVDFAWPDKMLAVEIEGGIWTGGRHTRGAGFENDCLKYNALSLAGWRLLRFTPEMVKSGRALSQIELALL